MAWTNVKIETEYIIEQMCWWVYWFANWENEDKKYFRDFGPYLEEPTEELLDLIRTMGESLVKPNPESPVND